MYTIIKKDDKFYCEGRLQDSTERWTEDTLEGAIKSMIKFAKIGNGTTISKKHITFLEPIQVVKTEYIEWRP